MSYYFDIVYKFYYLSSLFVTGVAVGSGWQSWVAYINLGSYYLVGVPLGVVLGLVFHLGVEVWIMGYFFYFINIVVCFFEIYEDFFFEIS